MEAIGVLLVAIGVLLAIILIFLWICLPFAVFGVKDKLDEAIKELKMIRIALDLARKSVGS